MIKLTRLLVLCLPLTLIGLFSSASFADTSASVQKLDKIIAIVNNGVITQNELNQQLAMIKHQATQNKVKLPPSNVLRKQVLQHLIDVDMQLQMAKRAGIQISSQEVDDAIKKIADRSHITIAQLRQKVEAGGLSYKQYRSNISKEITIARLQQEAVGKDIMINDQQVSNYLSTIKNQSKSNLEYHVKNILIPLPDAPTPTQVEQAKRQATDLVKKLRAGADFSMQAMAESSGQSALEGGDLGWRHMAALPDVFASSVAALKKGQISNPIRTPNGFHIIKLVGVRGSSNTDAITLYHVRHILLLADAKHTPQQVKQEIDKLRQQLEQGSKFSTLAEKYSQDKRSATKGGDLGWVHLGELPPSFNKAIVSMKDGQISQPIRTANGWSLVQVLASRVVKQNKAIERQKIRQYLYQRKFNQEVQNWLQKLRGSTYIKML